MRLQRQLWMEACTGDTLREKGSFSEGRRPLEKRIHGVTRWPVNWFRTLEGLFPLLFPSQESPEGWQGENKCTHCLRERGSAYSTSTSKDGVTPAKFRPLTYDIILMTTWGGRLYRWRNWDLWRWGHLLIITLPAQRVRSQHSNPGLTLNPCCCWLYYSSDHVKTLQWLPLPLNKGPTPQPSM